MIFVSGFAACLALLGILMAIFMPKMGKLFFVTDDSRFNYEETVDVLRKHIEENELNWLMAEDKDQTATYKKRGQEGFPYRLHVFKAGNPMHSQTVNTVFPAISTFMPAAISVCEDETGKTVIYRKNTSFMGKFFSGVVNEVMGNDVERDLDTILEGIIK